MDAWAAAGHRGVVEAVTGAGKTRVGLAAIDERFSAGGKSVVLVPTTALLHQWAERVHRRIPDAAVACLGDGTAGELRQCDVLVATLDSARSRRLLAPGHAALLVADECHRCASEVNRLSLADGFDRRLGLSATHARADGAHNTVTGPYFGGVVYRLGYPAAIAENVIARFKVALLAVSFSAPERIQYEYLDERVRRARRRLVQEFGVPGSPYGAFMRAINRLRTRGSKREAIAAGRYLSVFNRRRALMAETGAKFEALAKLEETLAGARRAIVFTQTVRSAERTAAELLDLGFDARALHSGLDRDTRRSLLLRFAGGGLHTIVAPQVLDEGLDVPDADLAIIVAASRQRRQMIQRMGRVLRRKSDGRMARFAVLFVEETSEDPALGAHETFLDEITAAADSVCNFPVSAPPSAVSAFLGGTSR